MKNYRFENYLQATNSECGLSCVAVVAYILGYKQPMNHFRQLFNVDRDGMTISNMIEIFERVKVYAKAIKVTEIQKNSMFPAVAYMNNNHFVVVVERNRNKISYFDPGNGMQKMLYDDFKKSFSGIEVIPKKMLDFEEINKVFSPWKNFTALLFSHYRKLIQLILLSILIYGITISIPVILQHQIDLLQKKMTSDFVNSTYFILLPLISWLIYIVITRGQNKLSVYLAVNIEKDLNKKVISHLLELPYKYFEKRGVGDIFYKLNLVNTMKDIFLNGILSSVISFGSVICILLYLLFLNRIIFLICLFTMLLIAVYTRFMSQRISEENNHLLIADGKLNNVKVELITSILTVKAMGIEKNMEDSILKNLEKELTSFFKQNILVKNNGAFLQSIQIFLPFFLVAFSISLVKNNILTLGALFSMFILSGILFSNSIQLFQNINNFYIFENTLRKINDILDEPIVKEDGKKKIYSIQSIRLSKVAYKYSDNSDLVLKNIDLNIHEGETVAIVGRTGSGKSTLLKLLSNLDYPSNGNVLINEFDLNKIDGKSFKKLIGIVPQQVKLFNKTIRENILLNSEYDDNKYWSIIKNVQLYDEIMQMPLKDKTQISEFGDNLSGGQVQRITLARALYREPKLLILDEATSSLDNRVEYSLNHALKHLNITKVIIAHRLSTIINADKILFLKDGRIIESGSHEELMSKKGNYFQLYNAQKEG